MAIWTRDIPTKPGWYWTSSKIEENPSLYSYTVMHLEARWPGPELVDRRERASVFVQFFCFIDQLSRNLGALGLPLSQWNPPDLQNRFLFRACGYRQFIVNALSHLKHFHTILF